MPHTYIRPNFVYTNNPDSDKERMQSLRFWEEDNAKSKAYWTKSKDEFMKQLDKHWEYEQSLGFDYISYHDGIPEFCEACLNNTQYRVLERRVNKPCYHTVYLKKKPSEDFSETELDNLIDRWHDGEGKGTHLWEWLGWSFEKYKEYVGGGEIRLVFDNDRDRFLVWLDYILKASSESDNIEFLCKIKNTLEGYGYNISISDYLSNEIA